MTTSDKLDIIYRWAAEFKIRNWSESRVFGCIWFDSFHSSEFRYTGNYHSNDDLIDEAYELIREYVWSTVK